MFNNTKRKNHLEAIGQAIQSYFGNKEIPKKFQKILDQITTFSGNTKIKKDNEEEDEENIHKKHSHEKHNSPKKHHKRIYSPDIRKIKKKSSNYNNFTSPKHVHQHHHYHKNIKLENVLYEENQLYNRDRFLSQDKPIKMNFVSQKFKIADDFNEKNSNQFLKEKDECLREVILSDKIEDEKVSPFLEVNEKGSLYELSPINKTDNEYNLNSKKIKRKKYENDSSNFLFELFDYLK